MQNKRYYNYARLLLTLTVMACIGAGCIKEDRSHCFSTVLEIKAVINVNGEEQEVGKDVVKEVLIYIFDGNDRFLGTQQAEIASTVSLNYPNQKELNLVCWGNSASDKQIMPTLKIGDKLDETLMSVIVDDTKSTKEMVRIHPDDLFHATKELLIASNTGSTVVILRPKVANISITARGLNETFTRASDDFSYVLRSGKKQIHFRGQTTGNDVHHTQKAEFKDGLHESDIFNILPSTDANNGIEVDIYKKTEVVATISTDDYGNTIHAKEGELLNIYANFDNGDGSVSISVAITPWGEKKIWKEIH